MQVLPQTFPSLYETNTAAPNSNHISIDVVLSGATQQAGFQMICGHSSEDSVKVDKLHAANQPLAVLTYSIFSFSIQPFRDSVSE